MEIQPIKYIVKEDTITFTQNFDCNLIDEIKNLIVEKNIQDITYICSPTNFKLNAFTQFNFPNNNIKKIYFLSDTTTNISTIDLSNLPGGLEELTIKLRGNLQIFGVIGLNNLPSGLKKLELNFRGVIIHACTYDGDIQSYVNTMMSSEIYNYFPIGLKYLSIRINQKISFDFFPESLETLIVYCDCNVKLVPMNNLPSGLKRLIISGEYQGNLNNLPIGLELLYLPSLYNNPITNFPQNLHQIQIPISYESESESDTIQQLNKIKSIKKIIIGHVANHHINFWSNFPLNCLPNSVEEICFEGDFNQPIDYLPYPNNIKKMTFGFNFNHTIAFECLTKLHLLETLIFGYKYNQPIFLMEFVNLKYLEFGRHFSQNLTQLPESLIHIKFGERFHGMIQFPPKLQILEFDDYAEHCYDIYGIPDSVTTIRMSKFFMGRINIPQNLIKITFPARNSNIQRELDKRNWSGEIVYI